jgi:hypothetical protein
MWRANVRMVVSRKKTQKAQRELIIRFVDWEIWRLVDWGLFSDTRHQVSEHGSCRILRREAAVDCAAPAALSIFSPHNLSPHPEHIFQ